MDSINLTNCKYATWNRFSKIHISDKLSFLNVNKFSLASKFDDFYALLSILKKTHNFYSGHGKTWLKASIDYLLELDGYKSCNLYRKESDTGGWIKLYYRDDITVNLVEEYNGMHESCETILIDAKIPKCGRIKVCALYRPPSWSISSFCRPSVEMALSSTRLAQWCDPFHVIRKRVHAISKG